MERQKINPTSRGLVDITIMNFEFSIKNNKQQFKLTIFSGSGCNLQNLLRF